MKILFVSNIAPFARHSYHLIQWLRDLGHTVHYAACGELPFAEIDAFFDIPIQRSPFSLQNFKAYRQLREIMAREQYDIVHCHTPMGGFLARIAAMKYRRRGLLTLYTAHGFHFYQGASLPHWLLYYPAEKLLAPVTDCLITMNREDYDRAKRKLRAGRFAYVHGVGLDSAKFPPALPGERKILRHAMGLREDAFVILFIGEMKKNQQLLLHMMAHVKEEISGSLLLLAGDGPELPRHEALAKELGIADSVRFLGWRSDIRDLLVCADIYVSSSLREGLPINIMEAMAMEKPIVATNIRGHNDLITDGQNGYLVDCGDARAFAERVIFLAAHPEKGEALGAGCKKALEPYLLEHVMEELRAIYAPYL